MLFRSRSAIEQTLSAAKLQHDDADKLQQQYEGRLVEWERRSEERRVGKEGRSRWSADH